MNDRNRRSSQRGKNSGRSAGWGREGQSFDRGTEVVGRAEWKLAEAVRGFGFDFRGKMVLDIGSSTGGFTEIALRRGARKVIAVEKGTRQMKAPLRFDARVELHEKTDIFGVGMRGDAVEAVEARDEGASGAMKVRVEIEPVEVVLADVSFVSLRPILTKARELAVPEADFLVMLKPQFEARPEQLVRGVVKNERRRGEFVQGFERWLKAVGWVIVKKQDNATVGRRGNRERFYWVREGR